MKIELNEITIRDIADRYVDNAEAGVTGYNGKLNIRPKYQREFIYNEQKRNAVLDTINKGFPLNVMYWVKNEDGTFEVLDGQQRTISFCQYVNSDFSLNSKFFHNLTKTEQDKILDYKCMIYICEGNDLEKLEWFKTINIAGEQLTPQELRNAVYTGPWLSDAKLKFSKSNCAAYLLAKDYVNGSPLRQEILETAISWINGGDIEGYMAIHQHDPNANELWTYFKNVVDWIQLTFTKYRKEMKGINWSVLYNAYHTNTYNTSDLEKRIAELYLDDDVTNKKGIYLYVLDGLEKHLNIRTFTDAQKLKAYHKQGGICPLCVSKGKPTAAKVWKIEEMEGDHITPWHLGGKTDDANCQMLCKACNREKGGQLMKDKTYDALKANIVEDLNKCNAKELDSIYKTLKNCLKKFDRDDIFKNSIDFFKKLFKSKKEKCLFFIDDIEDSKDKLSESEKEELRKYFLDISNIHRTFLENIQALLGSL